MSNKQNKALTIARAIIKHHDMKYRKARKQYETGIEVNQHKEQ